MDNLLSADVEMEIDEQSPVDRETTSIVSHNSTFNDSKLNDSLLEKSEKNCDSEAITYEDNSLVTCGRCDQNMSYAEYKEKHRHLHYNLCWIDGEEKIDYSNEKKMVSLLREILPKHAERKKKVSYTCEWCTSVKKSVLGYAAHVKKCFSEKESSSILDEPDEVLDSKLQDSSIVICGSCHKSMPYNEYEKIHKSTHYNLCWLNDNEIPNFDDENVTRHLLQQTLPKHAARQKKVKFTCEWCQVLKKSVPGFASHIKQCKFRPDKISKLNEINGTVNFNSEIIKEKLESRVICGRCNKEMTLKEYRNEHCSKHYNLCWIDGEEKLDLKNYETVLNVLKGFIPFKVVRSREVKLICEDCNIIKKSIVGFATHVIFCNIIPTDASNLLLMCEECGIKIKPSSLGIHKLKHCKGVIENGNDSICNQSNSNENSKMRRRKRPPNILSFHPDTKHTFEYYDLMCRLCNLSSLNINDMLNHILTFHDVDLNDTKSDYNPNDYIFNTYDSHRSLYLKPLLNYYNFFKKNFWKAKYHKNFQSNVVLLNSSEALKYLPSVQQSCKIFNSNKEEISVDLFQSTYVNGMHWLFTGGPNWAMSWCPVPEEVQTQYLAISCHPKPDLEHKEMNIYKYPSLVQLWTFNSLDNINFESVSDVPYMSYGLAHDFGAVWDMAWCPSGAYEPDNKIGLLALSTSSGDCPIFAMPYVAGNSKLFYIYKAKSVIARNFQCEWNEVGVQCTRVCWKAVTPFNTLICGYSNGMVSVFIINFKSIFLNDDVLYPSHTFRASKCSITGLSVNYLNSSILATTATDGNVTLWDLKSTENPLFEKKFYCPSDCSWLQQCYTLLFSSKSINHLFLKLRTINFSNYDDDIDDYKTELYALKSVPNSSKVINNCNMVDNNEKLNNNAVNETTNKNKTTTKEENTTLSDSVVSSDDESLKSVKSNQSSAVKSEDPSKNVEDDDLYGPSFVQKCTHWSVSGSNWMNVFATGDGNGVIYEKLFLPETNQIRKGNSTVIQLMVKKLLSNNTSSSEYSSGYCFKETIKNFGLESSFFTSDDDIKNNSDDNKQLLRYPLDNITKVSWNQNFSSFRWLAIGTQSGFALISPSQAIPNSCIELFYKTILSSNLNNVDCISKTDII